MKLQAWLLLTALGFTVGEGFASFAQKEQSDSSYTKNVGGVCSSDRLFEEVKLHLEKSWHTKLCSLSNEQRKLFLKQYYMHDCTVTVTDPLHAYTFVVNAARQYEFADLSELEAVCKDKSELEKFSQLMSFYYINFRQLQKFHTSQELALKYTVERMHEQLQSRFQSVYRNVSAYSQYYLQKYDPKHTPAHEVKPHGTQTAQQEIIDFLALHAFDDLALQVSEIDNFSEKEWRSISTDLRSNAILLDKAAELYKAEKENSKQCKREQRDLFAHMESESRESEDREDIVKKMQTLSFQEIESEVIMELPFMLRFHALEQWKKIQSIVDKNPSHWSAIKSNKDILLGVLDPDRELPCTIEQVAKQCHAIRSAQNE